MHQNIYIDTIGIIVDSNLFNNKKQNILTHLQNKSEIRYITNDATTLRGTINNFQITLSPKYLKIKGSLPVFKYGNNIKPISSTDLKDALDELCDMFSICLYKAKLNRIDVARSFFLKESVACYLDLFQDTPDFGEYHRIKRQTKRYSKENFSIQFYDKLAEMIANGKDIPEQFWESNILRYELQLHTRINEQLGYQNLMVVHLLSSRLLEKVERMWRDSFFKVFRKPTFNLKEGSFSPRKVADFSMLNEIEAKYGVNTVYREIDDTFRSKIISAAQRKYMRDRLRRFYTSPDFPSPNSLWEELSAQVNNG